MMRAIGRGLCFLAVVYTVSLAWHYGRIDARRFA